MKKLYFYLSLNINYYIFNNPSSQKYYHEFYQILSLTVFCFLYLSLSIKTTLLKMALQENVNFYCLKSFLLIS